MIKACVVYDWTHPLHKFFPGDRVRVTYVNSIESKPLKDTVGCSGVVIARSTDPRTGTARSMWRQFTRYYVLFPNGKVHGLQSCYLTLA